MLGGFLGGVAQYGVLGIFAAIIIILIIWIYKTESKLKATIIEKNMLKKRLGKCEESIEECKKVIEELDREKIKTNAQLENFELKLENLTNAINNMSQKLDNVINFYAQKAMERGMEK